jgi:hypothetical protein
LYGEDRKRREEKRRGEERRGEERKRKGGGMRSIDVPFLLTKAACNCWHQSQPVTFVCSDSLTCLEALQLFLHRKSIQ